MKEIVGNAMLLKYFFMFVSINLRVISMSKIFCTKLKSTVTMHVNSSTIGISIEPYTYSHGFKGQTRNKYKNKKDKSCTSHRLRTLSNMKRIR